MTCLGLLGCQEAELGSECWQPSSKPRPSQGSQARERVARPALTPAPTPQEKQDKAVLQSEVASLRQNNQRLQEESQAASEQLRKFAEIFCREKKEL